jgi:AmiR/NasT family two-component response regulator
MARSRKTDARVEGTETVYSAAASGGGGARADRGIRGATDDVRPIVVVGGRESELVQRATELGLEPLLAKGVELEETIAVALRLAAELDRLRTVTARLAQVERAKGILMERHKVSERDAHERMRSHARRLNVKLAAIAEAVEESYLLVPRDEA